MTRTYTLPVTQELEAMGIELTRFVASVTVNLFDESGGESARAELRRVAQMHGPFIEPLQLTQWAEVWVDANQDFIWAGVRISDAFS